MTTSGKLFLLISMLQGLQVFAAPIDSVRLIKTDVTSSFRGVSVVDDKVAWVSGSKGTVGKSKDGGNTWKFITVPGFEKSDFRDIEAWSDKEAVIMSSGTPAVVLRTSNGGIKWDTCFFSTDTLIFLDAFDFRNNIGLMLADPINGRHTIYVTKNKGKSWSLIPENERPEALPEEAAFAASGTCIRLTFTEHVVFVTNMSCFVGSYYNEKLYLEKYPPLLINLNIDSLPAKKYVNTGTENKNLTYGLYSVALNGNLVTGIYGDYKKPNDSSFVWQYLIYSKSQIVNSDKNIIRGYRSCIESLGNGVFITCGTNGIDLIKNNKAIIISFTGFNTVRKAKKGKLVLLAGDKGRIAILKN
ncbi:MAG: hypothetical protein H7321_09695 [Bacteroidia bacterium]|nr:hypothetical protein [Bacteroidia bacterium]